MVGAAESIEYYNTILAVFAKSVYEDFTEGFSPD